MLPARLPHAVADPLGPSSRRTAWVVSEIHYHPAPRADGRNLEFIELHNAGLIAEPLDGHRLAGEIEFDFPPGTTVPAGGFLIVAPAPGDVAAAYGLVPASVLGGSEQRLNNAGGTLQLLNPAGAVLLQVDYATDAPWPAAAAGAGHSLVLHRPSFGEGDPRAWSASALLGGSPGQAEPAPDNPWNGILLNEILARPSPPALDFIEIHNASPVEIDLGGARLTDDPEKPGFLLPPATRLPAGGFLAFDETQLGFGLAASGEAVFLYAPGGQRVLDALRFPPQDTHTSLGRHPDGGPRWRPLLQPTPGSGNAPPRPTPVILHEIMYHPIHGDDDEYIELFNPAEERIDLAHWRFVDGIAFEFPPGAGIPGRGYVVVARNAARLLRHHPGLDPARTYGDFTGALSNAGERIALAQPRDLPITGASGTADTQRVWVVVAEVTYADGGAWGRWADGGGSSLELRDPRADPELAANWGDSDESAKAPWTTLTATGVLDQGVGSPDQLQVLSQGEGAWLVDDLAVLDAAGANRLTNPGFDSGVSGWVLQGTLAESRWEPVEGASAPGSLRVEATGRGDTGANRIRTAISPALSPGTPATLRARVRWLRGHPEFLLRLRGNYLEAAQALELPTALGTPGAPNSRGTVNLGPALDDLLHHPVLPAAGEPVRVTVRATDPDGVASVRLRYRVDPNTTVVEILMADDGSRGDARAGDGIFSATLPPQSSGRLLAFDIVAEDGHPQPASRRFPESEALIRIGESRPPGGLGTYRLWMTQNTFNRWTSRSKLDNSPLPVAFVYGDERVVQGAQAWFAGSPHISPGYSSPNGNLCGYIVRFPDDDPFLGATEIVLDWPGRDTTAQQEPTAYWIARELGVPFNHRRYIRLHVNGVTETARGSIYEDAQQVNSDLIESWNPDGTGGDLFKIEQWFEFNDAGGTTAVIPPRLENYTTQGGDKKLARYRWNWLKRALVGSANDYRRLFTLVDAANATDPETYLRQLTAFVDLEEWMRVFAVENIVVNLDAWGYDIGKNMYAYKPPADRWRLYMWDIDWVMLASAQHGYSPTSPLMYRGPAVFGEAHRDPVVGRMYDHPAIQRAYWRAIADAVDGPLVPERVAARLDATHAALVAHGVTRSSGGALTAPTAVKTWLRQRRDYLVSQLASVAAPFSVHPPPPSLTGTNLLHLHGTAPIGVHVLQVNDRPFPVTWTSVTEWRLAVPLAAGTNTLRVQGYDRLGQPLDGASTLVTVQFDDTPAAPEESLVIHEIQARPRHPGAAFVEIFNRSAQTAFDLSAWRLDGLDARLAPGTLLGPRDYLLLAASRQSLAESHGIQPRVDGEFAGQLRDDGETLTLLRPGPSPGEEIPVNAVAYQVLPPWPVPAPESDASLQLIDPRQDNRHPANWAVAATTVPPAAETLVPLGQTWSYQHVGSPPGADWPQPAYNDALWPTGTPLFYHESASLPGPKSTPISLGRTTYYFRTRFQFSGDPASIDLALTTLVDDGVVVYLNGTELLRLGMPGGPVSPDTFAARTVGDAIEEGGFLLPAHLLLPGENVLAAEVHQVNAQSTDVVFGLTLNTAPRRTLASTPDAPNSVHRLLPPLPTLWINELQADNRTGPIDPHGDRDPWIELINAGPIPVDLDGCYLTDSLADPRRWAFPPGSRIEPGEFLLVWMDGEPAEATPSDLHASFRLHPSAGLIALVQSAANEALVLDAVHYAALASDHVLALLPDGHPEQRTPTPTASPRASNASAAGPPRVRINEWMSSNQRAVADPADGDFEDWFELHNPDTTPADLTGLFLSDDPANPRKFPVPPGTVIAPRGFLLVWADEESSQNAAGGDLHVNFRLSQNGESILLSTASGTLVDAIQFETVPSDQSGGRWPDGGAQRNEPLGWPTPGAPNAPPRSIEAPRILDVTRNDLGIVRLTWTAQPGEAYRLQATDLLPGGPWTDLTPELRSDGTTVTATEATTEAQTLRFYRVIRLR